MPTIAERLHEVNVELRDIRGVLVFSRRRRLAQAIAIIAALNDELPPERSGDAPLCTCRRAEVVTVSYPNRKEQWLRYELEGEEVLGLRCPYCATSIEEIMEADHE